MMSVGSVFGKSNGKAVRIKQLEPPESGIKRAAALVAALALLAGTAAYLLRGEFLSRAEAAQTYVTKDQLGTINGKLDLLIQLHGGALATPAPQTAKAVTP